MKDIKICMYHLTRAKCLLETKALVINSKSTDKIRSSSMCVYTAQEEKSGSSCGGRGTQSQSCKFEESSLGELDLHNLGVLTHG